MTHSSICTRTMWGDEHCDALAAERGIEVSPCKYQHRVGTIVERFDT